MHGERDTVRVEAFSDGVFAIAMTLLVIDIKVPSHDIVAAKGLARAVIGLWPNFLAFLTSFVTILVIWVHHHWIFQLIRRNDHPFLYWNGLLLLLVTFAPFPTALLAQYMMDSESRVAANLYTGTFFLISLAFDALWRHARNRLLSSDLSSARSDEAALVTQQYRFGPPLYFVAFLVSFASAGFSVALCLCFALFFAVRGWPFRR